MKKAMILYAVIFALTIIIPTIICFTDSSQNSSSDLTGIFRQCITLLAYYR